jgi:hypothetical protein
MKKPFTKLIIGIVLLMTSFVVTSGVTGCAMRGASTQPATDLQKIAHSYEAASAAMDTLQDAVLAAKSQNLLSASETGNIARVALRVDKGLKESVIATRHVAQLDEAQRTGLRNLLNPILAALDEMAADPAILGIKNEVKRSEIRALISAVQTTLTATKARLAP